jgi:hypothetical protein
MYTNTYNVFRPAYRHNCIGNAYAVGFNGFEDLFLMSFAGYDEDGDPQVHLVNLQDGHQWTNPIYVVDPDNLTDSEVAEIIDPELRGVEFVNLGPVQGITGCLEGPVVVQRTI